MSHPETPIGLDYELESLPRRSTVHLEDALIILCLIPLWLPVFGYQGPVVTGVMIVALVAMLVVLGRRKRRVDRLFAELRRRQQAQEALGGYPTIPGMIPPRMGAEPPESLRPRA